MGTRVGDSTPVPAAGALSSVGSGGAAGRAPSSVIRARGPLFFNRPRMEFSVSYSSELKLWPMRCVRSSIETGRYGRCYREITLKKLNTEAASFSCLCFLIPVIIVKSY